MTKDMTSGSTLRHIINFAVPLCMGMLFQQLYSMVDTMIVGKVLGVQPLAGVGATGSLNFMIIWFASASVMDSPFRSHRRLVQIRKWN